MSISDRKALPDVWKWWGGPPGSLLVVKMPSQMSGSGQKPSRKFISGRDAILDVRKWSRDPPGYQLVVGRFSRMSVIGAEALPDVREGSGGPPACP